MKKKNQHIEIMSHVIVWIVVLFMPVVFALNMGRTWDVKILQISFIKLIGGMIIFYLNYCYLTDKLWLAKKYTIFIVINLVLLVSITYLQKEIGDFFIKPIHDFPGKLKNAPKPPGFMYLDTLLYLIPVVFSVAIKISKKLTSLEVEQQEVKNIKLETEMQHLKYQLQPHFFFNALNNTYSLIDIAPEKAKQSIHSLSKLMRHILQSSENTKINLGEEVDFLKKYIELMQLRLSDNTQVTVDFPDKIPPIKIAPLLFISIVENAFKHGVSAQHPSQIVFRLKVEGRQIKFYSSNTNFPKNATDKSGSGIGVENLKKQLNLIYPHKHEISISNTPQTYEVKLSIKQ